MSGAQRDRQCLTDILSSSLLNNWATLLVFSHNLSCFFFILCALSHFPGFLSLTSFQSKCVFLSAGYLPILEHLVNTRLNYSERSRVSSAVDSTWELNERLWEKAGEACWPVTLRLDQVCVRRETVMVKLLSQKIIIAEALLAAGGRSVKDRKQKTMHRKSWWTENALCEFDLSSAIMSAEQQQPQAFLASM